MKVTQYFLATRNRPDRRIIQDEWIDDVINKPDSVYVQKDGRIRKWKKIKAAGDRYLRVVLLEDGQMVHNALFDRRCKEDKS